MDRSDRRMCQDTSGSTRQGALLRVWLALFLLLALLLTACSPSGSTEPTDYLVSSGKHRISYLTDDHPDVKQVTHLVAQFLTIDQTQDYKTPDYARLWGLVDQRFIDDRRNQGVEKLKKNAIKMCIRDRMHSHSVDTHQLGLRVNFQCFTPCLEALGPAFCLCVRAALGNKRCV